MTIGLFNISKFIEDEDSRIKALYGNYKDEQKRILVRTVKLGEEFGELCNEVLANEGLQNPIKNKSFKRANLEKEFADVIITTLLLARTLKIDIDKALDDKVKIIMERYKNY